MRVRLPRFCPAHSSEGGQILVMVALAAIILFAVAGLTVDVGRMFVMKAQLSRAMDAAALAGVLELDGTANGLAKAEAVCAQYLIDNEPDVFPNNQHASLCFSPGANTLKVMGNKRMNTIFMRLLGVNDVQIAAAAAAGFGIFPTDVYLAIDATGSMGVNNSDCNHGSTPPDNNAGCPIYEAKQAAKSFIDALLPTTGVGNGVTLVGAGAFRGCYNPPLENFGSPTPTATNPPSTATATRTPTKTVTPGGPTFTPTKTGTPTKTPTKTNTPAATNTATPKLPTPTGTPPTKTPTPTKTATKTSTPTRTPTSTATATPQVESAASSNPCVVTIPNINAQVFPLSKDGPALKTQVNSITTSAGSGTNVCLGLDKADEVLFGPGYHTATNTHRFIVMLSDGDNVYNQSTYQASPASPAVACQPKVSPAVDNGYNLTCSVAAPGPYTGCGGTPGCNDNDLTVDKAVGRTSGAEGLDKETYARAVALKAKGVEIYIVGFGVCPGAIPMNDTALCNQAIIGEPVKGATHHDNNADRNLLKCIASSTLNSNDHYYEVPDASNLPNVFQQIAQQIAYKLVE